jgi:endonuclease YncB( thermonuclease family)
MLKGFLCCFKPKSHQSSGISLRESSYSNFENISVCVTEDKTLDKIVNKPITLFDTKFIYDSNEWLNKLNKSIDWKDTIQFIPPIQKGFVIKVYDGDTITIASRLPYPDSPLYRFSVRLNGIDCPEMKSNNTYEKECALIAKNEMVSLVMNKIVSLKNVQTEKYGRILADVYIDDLHLNQHMLEKRLAIYYDGGTKISPKNWINYHLKGEL